MFASSSKVRVSRADRQTCCRLNFIAPFCLPARGYQLGCQREYPRRCEQACGLPPSAVEAGGKAGVSLSTGKSSRGPGWTLGKVGSRALVRTAVTPETLAS